VVTGDFNGDGKLDLAAAVDWGNYVSVLLGAGNGLFSHLGDFPSNAFPFRLAAADFNGDGILDLAVANNVQSGKVSVLLGNGDGTFRTPTSYRAGRFPNAVAVADLNHDGHADLVVANQTSKTVSVLLGKGDGTFLPKKDYPTGPPYPSAVAVADFNQDGIPDIVVDDASSLSASVLLGKPDGSYAAPLTYFACENPLDVRAADLNGDGYPDLAIASAGDVVGGVTVLLNDEQWGRAEPGGPGRERVAALSTSIGAGGGAPVNPHSLAEPHSSSDRPSPVAGAQESNLTAPKEQTPSNPTHGRLATVDSLSISGLDVQLTVAQLGLR
jgi:hypothetical protein